MHERIFGVWSLCMNAYSIASNFRTETLDFAWINNLKLYIIRLQKVGCQIKMDPVFIGTAALQKNDSSCSKRTP